LKKEKSEWEKGGKGNQCTKARKSRANKTSVTKLKFDPHPEKGEKKNVCPRGD